MDCLGLFLTPVTSRRTVPLITFSTIVIQKLGPANCKYMILNKGAKFIRPVILFILYNLNADISVNLKLNISNNPESEFRELVKHNENMS